MTRQPEVKVFLIDGLNNTGKTTQLNLLRPRLEGLGIFTAVKKGDGSRKGLGLHDHDPLSAWWQRHRQESLAAGTEGGRAERLAAIASQKLLSELVYFKKYDFPGMLSLRGLKRGVVLLDRGHISRLFVSRRFNPDITFTEAIGIEESPRLTESLPDRISILHADRATLLSRTEYRDDDTEKKHFNDDVIDRYYDDFEATIFSLPPVLAQRTAIVDATQTIEEVNHSILNSIQEMY